jgi:transcriptional regulator with PAS, ATPase and Fis domain
MRSGGDTSKARVGRSPHAEDYRSGEILIGISRLFRHVVTIADAVATNDCVVLLEGESGTGKELLARRIHSRSRRMEAPFIPLNCAGISETLFESQFFGHTKGAFTGAITETLGVVRAAEGGTLLLDEVSEIPYHLQAKLLRLLQEREVVPVGGSRPISVDVRFIASTNRNLREEMAKSRFRPDLYHRINIVRIEIPPLRCRPEDVDPLLDCYLDVYAQEYAMPKRLLGEGIRRQLREYGWPGNVRELCSYVERLYAADLPPLPPAMMVAWEELPSAPPPQEPAPGRLTEIVDQPLTLTLAGVEQATILRALRQTGWNRSAAARLLAVHRSTLLRKMRRYGLADEG